jgi:RimJ/RimL family protein N-acetyltransferase
MQARRDTNEPDAGEGKASMTETLYAKRLILRTLLEDDAVHFARLLSGDSQSTRMMATLPDPCNEPSARLWIKRRLAAGGHPFAILRAADGLFLGVIGCAGPPDAMRIGYWIGRPYWGRGYATEALRRMIEFARALGARKLEAETFTNNAASARVLGKAGFENVGTAVINVPSRGGWRKIHQHVLLLKPKEADRQPA